MLFKISLIGEIEDPMDEEIDVFIEFENGGRFMTTFITTQRLDKLFKKNLQSNELLSGSYLPYDKVIITQELSFDLMKEIINDLITNEDGFYNFVIPVNKSGKILVEQYYVNLLENDIL